jgi:hypothetical protein
MKTPYVNNIPLAHGEISIVLSDHAEKVMRHSCALGQSLKKTGINTLLINCGMSNKRFRSHAGYPEDGNAKTHLLIRSSVKGDLIAEKDSLDQIISECKIGVIIIAGWEWASSSFRRKQRLLFYLRELMDQQDIAVVIYTQIATDPVAGKYDKNGLGKVAQLAVAIVRDETSIELEKSVPKAPPAVYNSEEELREAERSAQLMISKVKGLGGAKPETTNSNEMKPKLSAELSFPRMRESSRNF